MTDIGTRSFALKCKIKYICICIGQSEPETRVSTLLGTETPKQTTEWSLFHNSTFSILKFHFLLPNFYYKRTILKAPFYYHCIK